MSTKADSKANRESERLTFLNAATLVMNDGNEISVMATDMGQGGVFLELTKELDNIQIGDEVKLKIELFGRTSTFIAYVAHKQEKGIGLRLESTQSL
jgi:hypothetical protein